MRKVLTNILLLASSLFISLILIEFGIRIFAPQPRYYAPQHLFVADDLLGYRLSPNFDGFYSTPEKKVKFRTNSKGLRERERLSINGIHILCLGDSFVMGVGVESEEIFLCLLEKYLNSDLEENRFVVINAGVQGYGTDQELSFLKKFGWDYKPDLVLLAFYPNDITENLIPNSTVKNGYIIPGKKSLPKGFKKHSFIDFKLIAGLAKNEIQLFRFIVNRLNNNTLFRRIFLKSTDMLKKSRKERIEIYAKLPGKTIQKGWDVTQKLLKEMKLDVKSNNSEFLVVYIPERMQVYKKQWERVKKQWELNEVDYDILGPNKILSNFCKENNISFLDLTKEFRNHVERQENIYYMLDPHLTVRGNEIAAKRIFKKIIDDNLINLEA